MASFLSRLFGKRGGDAAGAHEAPPVLHKDFRIVPAPMPEGGQYRLAARIEAEVDGETRVHLLIRADLFSDRDEAIEAALRKARQMIDEQGTRLFR